MLFSDYQIFRFLKAEIFFFSKVYKCQSVKKTLVKLLQLKQCLEPHFLNPSPMVASDTPLQNPETSQNKGEDTHALIVLMKRPKHRELKNFSQDARCKSSMMVQQDPAPGFSHLLSCAFSLVHQALWEDLVVWTFPFPSPGNLHGEWKSPPLFLHSLYSLSQHSC